jgi:hypothetical protein
MKPNLKPSKFKLNKLVFNSTIYKHSIFYIYAIKMTLKSIQIHSLDSMIFKVIS